LSKDGLSEKALQVYRTLLVESFVAEYDATGSIGRRYARADEAGTPLGVTVDYETLKNETVTIRDRDSWKQVRAKIEDLPQLFSNYFMYKAAFEDLGKLI
jgi:glycyl-tRNA synthetase